MHGITVELSTRHPRQRERRQRLRDGSEVLVRALPSGEGTPRGPLLGTFDARGGVPVGFARHIPLPGDRVRAEIGVEVAEGWRGRGLGALLGARLAARALAAGVREYLIALAPEHASVAAALERAGAERAGRRDGRVELRMELSAELVARALVRAERWQPPPSGGRLRVLMMPEPHSPLAARRALAGAALMPPPLLEDALLLVTELVTNSVLHAGMPPHEPLELVLERRESSLRAEVIDTGPGFDPRPRPLDPLSPGGFGLMLVDRLATRWGVERGRRTRVWFELEEPAG